MLVVAAEEKKEETGADTAHTRSRGEEFRVDSAEAEGNLEDMLLDLHLARSLVAAGCLNGPVGLVAHRE